MSTALSLVKQQELSIWEAPTKLSEIRKLFAPKHTDVEFEFFVGLGKALDLNPFTREIWSVKYGDSPAQNFVGRDGYRKNAQRNPQYDYHQCDAVYENDTFKITKGEVEHSYTLSNRGKLVGAYCIVKRRSAEKPTYVFVELSEYSTGKSLWHPTSGKPATMIKKVAEAQCLRACFQELFAGTYCEEEFAKSDRIVDARQGITQTERLKQVLNVDKNTGEVIGEPLVVHNSGRDDILVTEDQIDRMYDIMEDKGFDEDRAQKAIDYVINLNKVEQLEKLTDAQARAFILKLEVS
jgi:phage recombination protein Bet